jgi:membrane-associated phospholipid phosphatase
MPLADAFVRKPPSPDPSDTHPLSATRDWWALVGGIVLIVAGLALWHDTALNQALFHDVNDLGAAAPAVWSCLSVAGLGLAAWIYLTAFAERRPARVARLLWIIVVGGIVIHFIKHGFATPRPLLALGDGHLAVIGEPLRTQSMPSGHSAMAFAMLGLMVAARPRRPDSDGRVAIAAARLGWIALALGIALSRLAVGAHWPADALFGAGLGLLFAGLSAHAWPVDAMTRFLARPLGQRLAALGLVAAALSIAATPTVLAALNLSHSKLDKQLATGYPLAEPLQWALSLIALMGAVRWWRASTSTSPSGAGV